MSGPDETAVPIFLCPRIAEPSLEVCLACAAFAGEPCDAENSNALLTAPRIGGGAAGTCNPDDGVCEACQ